MKKSSFHHIFEENNEPRQICNAPNASCQRHDILVTPY